MLCHIEDQKSHQDVKLQAFSLCFSCIHSIWATQWTQLHEKADVQSLRRLRDELQSCLSFPPAPFSGCGLSFSVTEVRPQPFAEEKNKPLIWESDNSWATVHREVCILLEHLWGLSKASDSKQVGGTQGGFKMLLLFAPRRRSSGWLFGKREAKERALSVALEY